MKQTVLGIFDNMTNAQDAYKNLLSKGFNREQVDFSEDYNKQSAQSPETAEDKGGIAGFFDSLFGSNDDATKYKQVAGKGVVVTVHTESQEKATQAQGILDRFGAIDVDDQAQYNLAKGGNDAGMSKSKDSIPVIEEELEVGKRTQETGKVRIRSRIVEVPVEENLRLRSEHIKVERNPVNREATDADLKGFKEETIEMTAHAEKAMVNKEAKVVEEVNVRKDVEEQDKTIRENVKKTEVDVDKTGKDRHQPKTDRT